MNFDEISKKPNINGGTKRITREIVNTIQTADGELERVIEKSAYVGKEPDYVKIYTDCQLVFNNLDIGLSPYIIAFAKHMTFANDDNPQYRSIVYTNKYVREQVADVLNVSDRQVQRAIKNLVNSEIFIPIIKNGKQERGVYFVNPWVMAKGEWKDIKALRQSFEYVQGSNTICSLGEDGERRVLVDKTSYKDGKQLSLAVDDNGNLNIASDEAED